jgi:hypothetical protein
VIEGICSKEHPPLYKVGPEHDAACLWHDPRFAGGASARLDQLNSANQAQGSMQ